MNKETICIGAIGGLTAYIYNLPYELLILWCSLMVLDIITGIIKAAKKGELSSSIMKHGLLKKAGELSIMFSLLIIQRVAIISGIDLPIGNVIVGAFAFKEMFSIVENYLSMGGKLPNIVANWLKITKKELGD